VEHEPTLEASGRALRNRRDAAPVPGPDGRLLRHALEHPGSARPAELARLASLGGNRAVAQMVQRAAVKDTKLGGVSLVPEIGADFRNNHTAPDVDSAKTLSKSADRLARTNKNTVVVGSLADMTKRMGEAEYSATPLMVSGLNTLKITCSPAKARTPEQVKNQTAVPGPSPMKVKVRLVADDAAKLTTSPKSTDTGPILLATGVQG